MGIWGYVVLYRVRIENQMKNSESQMETGNNFRAGRD